MTLESWKSLIESIAGVLGLLAATCAVIALILSNKVNAIQKKESGEFRLQFEAQKERTANAEAEVLRLQKRVSPRIIDGAAFHTYISLLGSVPRPNRVEIMYLKDDPECFSLAQQLYQLIKQSGWNALNPIPIPAADAASFSDRPTAMTVGGQPSGVTIVAHSLSETEASAKLIFPDQDWIKTPWTVLSNAVMNTLGGVGGAAGGSYAPPEGTLRVVVAPRM